VIDVAQMRSLSRRDDATPAEALTRIASAIDPAAGYDSYGTGAIVEALEHDLASILGKERAVFSMSGKAAQLAMLRVHADRRGRRLVAAHPRSHIVEDESNAIEMLYGLAVARTGGLTRIFTADDLDAIREPLAAVVVELPLRRVAYTAPSWDALVAICERARSLGAAVHCDGARLWEVQPFYGRPHAEIAALFDTVYVSLYKGLGAPAGAALAGAADDVEAARVWITRAGAIVYRMYPMVAAAHAGFHAELRHMQAYYDYACALAAAFADLPGVDVVPTKPCCNAFVVHLRGMHDALLAAAEAVAAELGIIAFRTLFPTANPAVQAAEITVGTNTLAIAPAEARALFAAIVARASA
jgi:threonine aldolase